MNRLTALGIIAMYAAGCSGTGTQLENEEQELAANDQALSQSEPEFSKQWGLESVGATMPFPVTYHETRPVNSVPGLDINIRKAWEITTGSPDIRVAVVERSSFPVDHPEFSSGSASQFVGDNYIPDAMKRASVSEYVRENLEIVGAHASNVAAVLGAASNGVGMVGVAPGSRMVPITAHVDQPDALAEAIEYARQQGARIINISQGSDTDDSYGTDAIAEVIAEAKNMLFVCSAGNHGSVEPNPPGALYPSNILSVANVAPTGELWQASGHGPDLVDIGAPGTSVYTASVDGYSYELGTSIATPHVAGVAALVLSRFPSMTVSQLKQRIMNSAMTLDSLEGMVQTGGVVDAYAALVGVNGIKLETASREWGVVLNWEAESGERYEVERDGVVVETDASGWFVDAPATAGAPNIYRVRRVGESQWSHRAMVRSHVWSSWDEDISPQNRESAHPYAADTDENYTITRPGADRIRIHFESVSLAEGDSLEYYRFFEELGKGTEEARLTGSYPNGFWTHWHEGNSFSFSLTSSRTSPGAYGFRIDRVEIQ